MTKKCFWIFCLAVMTVTANEDAEGIHIESMLLQSVEMERRLHSQNLFFWDGGAEEYLTEVLRKLVTKEELELYSPRVRVLRSNAVNAFAAPHGTVFVCTGLLSRVTSEGQAAAILAHEFTHIAGHHAAKNLVMLKARARAKEPVRQGLALTFGDGVSGAVTGAALNSAISGYNRELEREADSIGLLRMAAAGYPHAEFYDLFAMLSDHIAAEKIKEPYFFSTHPRMVERLENYRRIVADTAFVKNAETLLKTAGRPSAVAANGVHDSVERGFFCIKMRSVILYDAFMNRASGRFTAAAAQLDRLFAVDSADVTALVLRGDIERMSAPRDPASVEWYKRALRRDKGNVAAARALGFTYHSLGDKGNAKKYLNLYCELAGETAADLKMAKEMLRRCE